MLKIHYAGIAAIGFEITFEVQQYCSFDVKKAERVFVATRNKCFP